jgi:hypothetical protein
MKVIRNYVKNLNVNEIVEAVTIEDNDFFYRQIISSDDAIKSTLKNEL